MGSLYFFSGMNDDQKQSPKFQGLVSQSIIVPIGAILIKPSLESGCIFYGASHFCARTPIINFRCSWLFALRKRRGLNDFEKEWPAKNHHYEESHDPSKRFPRGFNFEEEISDNFLRLGIARYGGWSSSNSRFDNQFKAPLDSLGWKKTRKLWYLHRIYLDDSVNSRLTQWGKLIDGYQWTKSISSWPFNIQSILEGGPFMK